MQIICADAETYFDNDFTLSKMTTESYIRDPRFECHGWAIKWSPNTEPKWYTHEEAQYIFKQEDWSNIGILAHHSAFDGLILSHHYGVKPKFWFDSLSCARLMLGNHISVGLDSLAKHFGLAAKTVPYNLFRGKHWHELPPDIQQQVGDGACHDVSLTWELFQKFVRGVPELNIAPFPQEEFSIIDIVIRMFVDPVLRADVDMLAKVWEKENVDKNRRIAALGVTESDLQSSDRFAALLRDEGVEPEMKQGPVSIKTGNSKLNYAFAKTDEFMRGLLEDENERIRALAEARLGVKSTLMQTRAETLGWMASRGPLCVYLRYAGAGTLRVAGGDGANWLNFKRGSAIRRAILAPEGYLLAPIDSSQIECRVLNYLAGQDDVIEKFRTGQDPYVGLASAAYGETIYKPAKDDPRKEEMEQKRGMGKQGELMCGYGAAAEKFKITAKNGLYGPPVILSDEQAQKFVSTYRTTHPAVCAKNTGYWAQAERMLARLAGGPPMDWGPLHVREHRIYLPNGCPLIFDTLEYHRPEGEELEHLRDFERDGFWRLKTRQGWKKMWGSKLVQNICEAVSRVIVSQAAIRINHAGYRILNWPYDELLILIPRDGQEQQHVQYCQNEMTKEPTWLPGIPLACEGEAAERYSK